MNIDLKSLLKRLNRFCTSSLEGAAGLSVSRTHYEVMLEHFLLKICEADSCDASLVLSHFNVDTASFQHSINKVLDGLKTGNSGRPVFSPLLVEWLEDAWLLGSIDYQAEELRSGFLLAALLANRSRYGIDMSILGLEGLSFDVIKKQLNDIVSDSSESPKAGVDVKKSGAQATGPQEGSALSKFTINFTDRAGNGEIDPVFGRDSEIRQIVDILARRRKNNPIAVGEPGVGKTAVVEGLALKIVNNEVPSILRGVDILGLDLGLLQAGAGVKGEFENRLKAVISEVKASEKPIIIFIDEAHTLIGAGGSAGGSDAANLLKPALARGELRTVAATTWSEYKKYFEKDPALARRFQLVRLEEPSIGDAVTILRGLKENYEHAHNVYISDSAVVAAARLSGRYISGRQLPDKAVDVLDTAAARVKVGLTKKPDDLEDLEMKISTLNREYDSRKRDETDGHESGDRPLFEVQEEIIALQGRAEELTCKWQTEIDAAKNVLGLKQKIKEKLEAEEPEEDNEASTREDVLSLKENLSNATGLLESLQSENSLIHTYVSPDVVARVIGDWTGVPVGNMLKDDAASVLEFEVNLQKRIKGQDDAVRAIGEGIKAAKSGLSNPDAPMGVFLLVGPSGVGKTETATGVADLLFGGERFMTTINMSEFQEKHTVSRLVGSPPGYVGYGEGGLLTEAVRQRPYSVVLLDEVEKADLEVMNIFYQVFDKGMLSDGEGRLIDFKNTVLFLTSNLASDKIQELSRKNPGITKEETMDVIRPVLSRHFKPALLARMVIVPFCSLGDEALSEIVKLKLAKLSSRLFATHKISLEFDELLVEHITSRCTEVETGARNIDHILQGALVPRMSTGILSRMSEDKMPEVIKVGISENKEFVLEFC